MQRTTASRQIEVPRFTHTDANADFDEIDMKEISPYTSLNLMSTSTRSPPNCISGISKSKILSPASIIQVKLVQRSMLRCCLTTDASRYQQAFAIWYSVLVGTGLYQPADAGVSDIVSSRHVGCPAQTGYREMNLCELITRCSFGGAWEAN
ncbi:hypothetical protein FCM35_KLT07330 [Carex littledalei]|uniref:Uncharacterized protein n=1 Tax=Carex littledalei TaxID=544730 RepID=A0A833QWI5_9POAL|nr:hypothetical protein FCM35_KLT07330 [Carex littledalei]